MADSPEEIERARQEAERRAREAYEAANKAALADKMPKREDIK